MRKVKLASEVAVCVAAACLAAACAGSPSGAATTELKSSAQQLEDYQLGPADKIRLIVFGEPDLSGEFSVNARGQLSLPLLGEVDAAGLTVKELRQQVADDLSDGYVLDARVAAEVVSYRPYYILGEVDAAGEYPYSTGLSVMKAVAAAGGYTYRANKSSVFIKRVNTDEEVKYKVTPQLMILPGDVVRVGERFF